jgi:hypothetical protein
MAAGDHSEEVFLRLRGILSRHVPPLVVTQDEAGGYTVALDRPAIPEPRRYFGSVAVRRNYVSYYLIGVYSNPEIREEMSAALRKRMQGKSCFNFTTVDEGLFGELVQITDRASVAYPEFLDNFIATRGLKR